MNYLDIEKKELEKSGAIFTAMEISGQPNLWVDIYNEVKDNKNEINDFLTHVQSKAQKVILTGAGTSAYIGFSLEGIFQRKTKITTLSIPTTHLVSHPTDYFESETPTLLISFARSGNSPESVAAVELAEKHIKTCYHLIITCNKEGQLANHAFKNNSYLFCLPPDSNDKSLAMTGSYSGMLLAALLINEIEHIDQLQGTINTMVKYGQLILTTHLHTFRRIAQMPFERAVFLGSGPLYGTCTEAQLKLQELTDGQVICKNDTYLGFRHGPKAVVNERTLMVYFLSNQPEVLRYESDLVRGMKKGKPSLFQVGICEKPTENIPLDEEICMFATNHTIPEAFLTVPFILVGQLLGFFKSLHLNLQPDSPSKSGAISRVVEGVVIYN